MNVSACLSRMGVGGGGGGGGRSRESGVSRVSGGVIGMSGSKK